MINQIVYLWLFLSLYWLVSLWVCSSLHCYLSVWISYVANKSLFPLTLGEWECSSLLKGQFYKSYANLQSNLPNWWWSKNNIVLCWMGKWPRRPLIPFAKEFQECLCLGMGCVCVSKYLPMCTSSAFPNEKVSEEREMTSSPQLVFHDMTTMTSVTRWVD